MSPLPKKQPETQLRLNINASSEVWNEVMTITPQLAEIMLEHNTKNRPLRKASLNHCIRQLKAGNFHLTGDSITCSDTGRLLNGQNRLHACVMTGIPFQASMLYGVKEESFHVMDTGAKRSAADVLFAEHGVKNAPQISAMVKFISMYKDATKNSDKIFRHTTNNNLTSKDIMDHYLTYGDEALQRSMLKSYHPARKMGLPNPALFGGLHYIASQIDAAQADKFFHGLITNEMLTSSDPHYRAHHQIRTETLSRVQLTAIIAQAWNRYRKGQTGRLMYKPEDGIPVLV